MTAFRVRLLLAMFCTGAVIGASIPQAHAASTDSGMSVCFALREGVSLGSVETALLAQGYTDYDAGTIVGQQVRDRCPDLKARVLAEAREALR